MSNEQAGVSNTDLVGRALPGEGQKGYAHSESGNSGNSTTTSGGPGTSGAGAEANKAEPGDNANDYD